MSSIRRKQIERVMESAVRLLYSEGVKPTNGEVMRLVSQYFSDNPAGLPVRTDISRDLAEGGKSNVRSVNEAFLSTLSNIEVLYECSNEQVEDVMRLTTEMNDFIKRLKARRAKVAAKLDDHLLSLFNSDGYYFGISDSFSDLNLTDLNLTSAFVSATEGSVSLPTISRSSQRVSKNHISVTGVSAWVNDNPVTTNDISPVSFALDGASNTVWALEVETDDPSEVVVEVDLELSSIMDISRIEIDPYGMTAAQWTASYRGTDSTQGGGFSPFGSKIVTSSDRFSIRNNSVSTGQIKLRIRKTKPDYEDTKGGRSTYRYIIGAKDIIVSFQVYDSQAIFVSTPLSVWDPDIYDSVIDAVSLVTETDIPSGTDIQFYVAQDMPDAQSISEFEWSAIEPIDGGLGLNNTVRFDGARKMIKEIVSEPTASSLQKIAPDFINNDLSLRNPTRSIIDGVDVYRLAGFDEDAILSTMRIDEGVNTVRIYHRPLSDMAVESLDWWADKRDSSQQLYSRIDSGNEFFYGGAVGESSRSVYVETYIEVMDDMDPLISTLKKMDPNSQTWKLRAFLNGNEVGYLDNVTDSANLPWPLRKGLNHIVLLINIPAPSQVISNPYVGTIDLLGGYDLFDYGLVRLDTWRYIDFFDLQYNQPNDDPTFTIRNGEIISKRKPSGNLRVVYSKATGNSPKAIRLRADLGRKSDSSTVTPVLDKYRVRFSYSEE